MAAWGEEKNEREERDRKRPGERVLFRSMLPRWNKRSYEVTKRRVWISLTLMHYSSVTLRVYPSLPGEERRKVGKISWPFRVSHILLETLKIILFIPREREYHCVRDLSQLYHFEYVTCLFLVDTIETRKEKEKRKVRWNSSLVQKFDKFPIALPTRVSDWAVTR